jgi:nicotinamide riboside kinase
MAKKHTMRVAVVGPESCGKSTLAQKLAQHLDGKYVPEMARSYFENHAHSIYTINDVIAIAQLQQETEDMMASKFPIVLCDTSPLVSRIWAEVRFGHCPSQIEALDMQSNYTFTLLCAPDLPWEPDPLRENPHNREKLFQIYAHYLRLNSTPHAIITGQGLKRYENALQALVGSGIGL